MKFPISQIALLALIAGLALSLFALPGPTTSEAAGQEAEPQALALINARVFDGERLHEHASILLRDGRVEALGSDLEFPEGVELIDIEGQTLLPGLIDAHVHAFNGARSDALRFGVTTMLDMFRPPFDLDAIRAERESLTGGERADVFSAGYLATAEGGHGTQYGIAVPTLADPSEAEAWVEARLAEGSDYIKIVIEDGSAWNGSLPTLDASLVEALVRAARSREVLAVAHVSTEAGARMALDAGVDGLVHLFADRPVDAEFAQRLAEADVFVIPTATVLAGSHGHPGRPWLEGESLERRLSGEQRQTLEQSFPGSGLRAGRWPIVPESIRVLHEAGVELLAGSDAPNPATAHGASLLHELKLLVDAGLSPIEALRSATSLPAARFGLPERGCLQPGCRADLVWIDGDPVSDIDEIRRVRAVWKNGQPVELDLEAAAPAQAATAEAMSLPVDLHASGQWLESTDAFMGGQSTAELRHVDASDAVRVDARLNPGFAFPYAGAMWNPAEAMMEAVNLSEARTLSLTLDAESGTYQLMFFSGETAMAPPVRVDLAAGAEQHIDLTGFSSLDRSRLRAIGIYAVGGGPELTFTVRNARLH
ncbi:amidohydrolase family protein [Wenzhouxiangella marina]|nr:amidohydrolase family protein [Wenzhouxiangella marina]MBB6086928.1 imidazolonepropionase-like amidohydrolase [Wenzhouxiangella marina]